MNQPGAAPAAPGRILDGRDPMPPLSILLKPASSGCNLRCTYCFYADEASIRANPNYGLMPEEVSHALIQKALFAEVKYLPAFFLLCDWGRPRRTGVPSHRWNNF